VRNRQIQFDGVGRLSYVERSVPELIRDDILVKVERCGLCTWERYIFAGTESMPFPFVGGHELAGMIVALGPDAPESLKPGRRCAVGKWRRCGGCEPCRRGLDNFCVENFRDSAAGYSGPGGFAEYMVCKPYEVFPVSDDVPPSQLVLGEPLACVVRGVDKLGVHGQDTVVVVGAGLMGLLFLAVLKQQGLRVVVVQRSKARRDLAKASGADLVIDPAEPGWIDEICDFAGNTGVAGVVLTAGGADMLNQALELTDIGTTVVCYAPFHVDRANVNVDLIHFKELTVTGALRHDSRSFRRAVRLIDRGALDLSRIRLVDADFADFEAALDLAEANRDIHRVVLRWDKPK
jgi:L-iditol 2-dehydrogenase